MIPQTYPIPPYRWDGSKVHPLQRIDRRPDDVWASSIVDKFPKSWQTKLLARWQKQHLETRRGGNITLLQRVRKLSDSARGGISPDAGDVDICQQADVTARDFARRIALFESIVKKGERLAAVRARYGLRVVSLLVADFCRQLLDVRGLADLWPDIQGRLSKNIKRLGAIKRLQCARWWRRTYRKLHARTVEASAIGIGLVSRAAGLYASDDAVQRRTGQNLRNAAVLASVNAINDHGQAYTLADLAAKGTANKSIRRVELLTRIAGFELIAKNLGHEAFMVTVSCPSRFHKCTTRGGYVAENPKYDDSTPADAQKYLSGQWARLRAAAAREGLDWYGFRIAEPQHDGTPHWHVLLFMPDSKVGKSGGLVPLVRRYFLDNESPTEPGASKHRIDTVRIDWSKGSAVGYVIKYISKNIDGHGVGYDLFGNDAITSSQRVEAWAATWRIRQFQQLGGAPVGVWRELRRLHQENIDAEAPKVLSDAINAINRQKTEPGVASIAWKKYIEAQGGIGCRRAKQSIRLLKEQTGELGRYGEPMAPRAVGISAAGVLMFRNHIHVLLPGAPMFSRPAFADVESERAQWLIAGGDKAAAVASARRLFGLQRSAASTWIHVNNCTEFEGEKTFEALNRPPIEAQPPSMFGPVRTYRRKLRKFRGSDDKPLLKSEKTHDRREQQPKRSARFAFDDEQAPW